MRKLLCPQCKIAGLYVKNERKERLLVYVSLKLRESMQMTLQYFAVEQKKD